MSPHAARLGVVALAAALLAPAPLAGCAGAGDASSSTAPAAAAGLSRPTSPGPVDPRTLPPGLHRADSLAGADPSEAACVDTAIAAALGERPELAGRADAHAGIAGTAVVACLPLPKLAAALTDRLRSPALGVALDEDELACARATLVASATDPAFTTLVGGLAIEDADVVRAGAAGLDTACGTRLVPPPGG